MKQNAINKNHYLEHTYYCVIIHDKNLSYVKEIYIDEYSSLKTFQDLLDACGLTKELHALIIGENGLNGKVYRYNNYNEDEIVQVGTTMGYA